MKIQVNNIDSEFKSMLSQLEVEMSNGLMAETKKIVDDLANATPIDTGRAKAGWSFSEEGKSTLITNDVPYIDELNHGHSKQAPTHFVERTLLAHGTSVGTLVVSTPP
jgi:hypothetical protein